MSFMLHRHIQIMTGFFPVFLFRLFQDTYSSISKYLL